MMPFSNWDEPEPEPSPELFGFIHKDEIPDIDICEDMLKGVIEALYLTGNVESLEECLDELAAEFNIELPNTGIIFKNKTQKENNNEN